MTDTCEFGRYDKDGQAIEECQRTDYEEVVMGDGGVVRLCPHHRSWAVAMASRLDELLEDLDELMERP